MSFENQEDFDNDPFGRRPRLRTPIAILKLLNCEGFTADVERWITRYNRTNVSESLDTIMMQRQSEARMILDTKLDDQEKAIVGMWIRDKCKANFDVGLRSGLSAIVARTIPAAGGE